MNAIDAACMDHDKCYDNGSLSAMRVNNPLTRLNPLQRQCRVDCDKSLCQELRDYVPKDPQEALVRWEILAWFQRFGKCQ